MSTSSPTTSSPVGSSPNSNFVSASRTPRSAAWPAAKRYSSIDTLRTRSMRSRSPTSSAARSKSIASSWPTSAFVDGVKIGDGSCSDSCRPAGSSMPETLPVD